MALGEGRRGGWGSRSRPSRSTDSRPGNANPVIVWNHRSWTSIMVSTAHHECLVYRRGERIGERIDGAGPVALRVSGRDHVWTDAGRQAFAGIDAPGTIRVEVMTGTARRRLTALHEYHLQQPAPHHATPAPKPLQPP